MKLLISWLLFISILNANEPIYVDFKVLGAVVGMSKIDGSPWDTTKKVDKQAVNTINSMASLSGAGVATDVTIKLGELALKGAAAPDVIGYIQQTGPIINNIPHTALMLANSRTRTKDSYTPLFSTGYTGWPILTNTRFQIVLIDKDFMENDPIATVEITYEDIQNAIKEGKAIWINVAKQSMNQLLFIQITANLSQDNVRPAFIGYRWGR
jgi:hypothetical protein